MSDLETAAPGVAADEAALLPQDQNDEGQVEGQPAPEQSEEQKKSASQERRERRKAHEQRLAEDASRAKQAADEYRSRLERIKAATMSETPPRESDFTDPVEYAAASALFKQRAQDARRQQAEIEGEAQEHEKKATALEQARIAERFGALEEQKAEARQSYADFDETFAAAIIPPHVAQIVIESDQAADIAYHLGKNPALARQIANMNPLAIAREIGRIEAQVSLPRSKTQSTAPTPISPVKPGGTSRRNPGEMTPQEFAKWRDSGGTF